MRRVAEAEWLIGGGAAGTLIHTRDWSSSPLGLRAFWPGWLRSALNLTLASHAPMALLVGRERVFFCNDAFRAANPDTPAEQRAAGMFPEELMSSVINHGETIRVGGMCCSPVRDERGEVTAALIATTHQQDADVRLQESTALLAALSDSSEDVIFAKDRHGRMRFANPATLALIGRSHEEVIGKTDAEFLTDHDAARQVMENDARIMESGAPTEIEEEVPLPDGTPRVWLSRKVAYRDLHGRVAGLLGISTDITQRKRTESALRRSEERFRSVVESMSEGLMIFDPDANLTYQNPASLRIHGFALGQDGRVGRDQVPITWEAWDENNRFIGFEEWPVSRVFRHERFERQVLHVRRVDTGHEFYGSYNGSPVNDEDGKLVVGFITIRDISDEVRAEAALRESEKVARASLDAAQLGTWHRDLRSGEILFDPRAAEHYGFSSGRATFEELLGHVHPDDLTRVRAAAQEAVGPMGTGRYVIEYRTVEPGGFVRWLAVHAHPRFEEGGDRYPIGIFGTSQDITSRKEAEQALEEANARLREADQRKDEFLAVLSHELRNPLSPIRTSVHLLKRAPLDEDRSRRALAVVDRQTQHMARLVDDLLDVTRIGRGKIKLQRQLLDLTALARSTAEDHQQAFATCSVELALDIAAGPLWVDGDPTRIAQVMGNLLNNAAKFTPSGGRTELWVGVEDPWAVIRVRDSGAGMSKATLEQLFQSFMQAVQTIERSSGGLGLGLALVKGLAELHGGSAEASSAGEGLGAVLTVRLPLALRVGVQQEGLPIPRLPTTALRVLIVEDNVDAAAILKDVLELNGHQVVSVAYNGVQGVEAARKHRPDVVLCDLGLPKLDGFGVARMLRAEDAKRSSPVFLVALSGYALAEDVARAKHAGFDHHMAKPANMERLDDLLSEAASRPRG